MGIDITILPAALEAGARAICLAQGYCWDCHPGFRDAWATEARAAFLAIVENWEGVVDHPETALSPRCLWLPLTEKPDDNA